MLGDLGASTENPADLPVPPELAKKISDGQASEVKPAVQGSRVILDPTGSYREARQIVDDMNAGIRKSDGDTRERAKTTNIFGVEDPIRDGKPALEYGLNRLNYEIKKADPDFWGNAAVNNDPNLLLGPEHADAVRRELYSIGALTGDKDTTLFPAVSERRKHMVGTKEGVYYAEPEYTQKAQVTANKMVREAAQLHGGDLKGLSDDEFSTLVARTYAVLATGHSYSDGNNRTIVAQMGDLGRAAGRVLDLSSAEAKAEIDKYLAKFGSGNLQMWNMGPYGMAANTYAVDGLESDSPVVSELKGVIEAAMHKQVVIKNDDQLKKESEGIRSQIIQWQREQLPPELLQKEEKKRRQPEQVSKGDEYSDAGSVKRRTAGERATAREKARLEMERLVERLGEGGLTDQEASKLRHEFGYPPEGGWRREKAGDTVLWFDREAGNRQLRVNLGMLPEPVVVGGREVNWPDDLARMREEQRQLTDQAASAAENEAARGSGAWGAVRTIAAVVAPAVHAAGDVGEVVKQVAKAMPKKSEKPGELQTKDVPVVAKPVKTDKESEVVEAKQKMVSLTVEERARLERLGPYFGSGVKTPEQLADAERDARVYAEEQAVKSKPKVDDGGVKEAVEQRPAAAQVFPVSRVSVPEAGSAKVAPETPEQRGARIADFVNNLFGLGGGNKEPAVKPDESTVGIATGGATLPGGVPAPESTVLPSVAGERVIPELRLGSVGQLWRTLNGGSSERGLIDGGKGAAGRKEPARVTVGEVAAVVDLPSVRGLDQMGEEVVGPDGIKRRLVMVPGAPETKEGIPVIVVRRDKGPVIDAPVEEKLGGLATAEQLGQNKDTGVQVASQAGDRSKEPSRPVLLEVK